MKKNYITAKTKTGEIVKVHQSETSPSIFTDENGKEWLINELDLLSTSSDDPAEEHFDLLKDMLEHLNPERQAAYRATLEEIKYWRELRGMVFIELLKKTSIHLSPDETVEQVLRLSKRVCEELFAKNAEFAKERFMK